MKEPEVQSNIGWSRYQKGRQTVIMMQTEQREQADFQCCQATTRSKQSKFEILEWSFKASTHTGVTKISRE